MEKTNEEKKQEASKVTSSKDVDFPSLGWGIKAGEVRELPESEEARAAILANHFIEEVKK